jgi:hypothetical protein
VDLISDTTRADGPASRAIWKVDGDTLTICSATGGKPRPTTFDSPKGSTDFLYTFRRVTAARPAAKRGDPIPLGGGGTGVLLAEWEGGSTAEKDTALWKERPAKGYIADAKGWEALWDKWGAGQPRPPVDFAKELLLVAADTGPRVAGVQPTQTAAGDLRFSYPVNGAGTGFSYRILKVSREGVKSVNGKPLPAD